MERVLSALRSSESKIRLSGVGAADPYIDTEGWEELLSALVGCLSDNNSKVAQGSLKVLAKLVASPHKSPDALRPCFALVWGPLKEKMGDSKLPAREAATDLLLVFMDKLGMSSMMDRFKLCAGHKNWRTREQILVAILLAMQRFRGDPNRLCLDGLVDMALKLLEDSAKEVRDASINVLEALYSLRGHALLADLQSKHIRNTHMRMLLSRFGADDLSSLARGSTAQSSSPPSSSRSLPSSPPKALAPSPSPASGNPPPPATSFLGAAPSLQLETTCKYSDRELMMELQQIGHGLATGTDWAKRVEALQQLQRVVASGGAFHAGFAPSLRALREPLCEQVGDLRSTVAREACATITALASALTGDDSWAHLVEFFVAALLKATYVTIQVISTSADACIKSIIHSGRGGGGYVKALAKFIEGVRARNQVLRLHCVEYVTLALTCWHVTVLDKYVDTLVGLLPAMLLDAQADVRAASRKCFWAFHAQYESRALHVLHHQLDSSTQRRLQDDRQPCDTSTTTSSITTATSSSSTSTSTAAGSVVSFPSRLAQPPPSMHASSHVKSGALRVENVDAVTSSLSSSSSSSAVASGPARVLSRKSVPLKDPDDASVQRVVQGPLRVLSTTSSSISSTTTGVASSSSTGDHNPTTSSLSAAAAGAKRVEFPSTAAMSTSVVASSHSTKSLPPPSGHNARHGDSATWIKGQYATEVEKDEMAILGLLDKADDALWLTRLAALDHLVQVVQSSSSSEDGVVFVASVKMVKLVQRRLGDSHYRVVHAALKLTLALLTASTSTTSSTSLPWKSILPKVFAKAVDVKDSVRLAAESVLNAFQTVVDASALAVAVASTMLDGIPTKVKAVVIAFMTPLVPLAVDVFSNTSFVRSLVLKIVLLVEHDGTSSTSSSTTSAAVGGLVHALYANVAPTMAVVESHLPTAKATLLQRYKAASTTTSRSRPLVVDPPSSPATLLTSEKRRLLGLEGDSNNVMTTRVDEASPYSTHQENCDAVVGDLRKKLGREPRRRNNQTSLEQVLSTLELIQKSNASTDDILHAVHAVLPEFRAAAADAVDVYLVQTIPALLDVALGCGDADEFKGMQTRIMQTVSGLVHEHRGTVVAQLEPLVVVVLERCRRSNNIVSPSSLLGQYFVDKTLQLCLATVNAVAQVELLVPLLSTLTSTDVQVVLKCLRLALEQLDMESFAASATTSFDATAAAVISCLHHSSSGVRKNAVACLVALYFLGGSAACAVHLDKLPPHHQKLVGLYIDKKARQHSSNNHTTSSTTTMATPPSR
ncbi:hypothetical protein H257_10352 [Aphanomyces astaci]|uniref:TOG domain-containing protein n=1 Tax=Aphanomyces astaci TaxID=112090 RepID=W4G8C8_APHAT|nr:hypothetical protein H257_10352 [Aphanomyces astaci]ETV75536.1 hypothetical protein H257_10352 [Aphanomyces astaci]|eukprot:XP_009835170.1 hypothetical protein H257_10352 [Aphanomyces astaci]